MTQGSGRVPGYARLQAQHADVAHLSDVVLSGLEAVAERVGQVLTIFSGYRSPGYSAAVGGYSTDPHTRGVAADVNVGGSTLGDWLRAHGFDPVSLLASVGLESGAQPGFYRGGEDPSHVQVPGSGVDKSVVDYGGNAPDAGGSGTSFSFVELEQLWLSAGGSPTMAATMAAIALAESGGCRFALAGPQDVRPVKACRYRQTSGENSVGLWQINVQAHPQFNAQSLFDPLTNARAAVAVLGGGSPTPWSTYTNGAYRSYLGGGSAGGQGVARPGGSPSDSVQGSDVLFGIPGTPDIPNPWGAMRDVLGKVWGGVKAPVNSLGGIARGIWGIGKSFVALVTFIIDPTNWLRLVELIFGIAFLVGGLYYFSQTFRRVATQSVVSVVTKNLGGFAKGAARGGGGPPASPVE